MEYYSDQQNGYKPRDNEEISPSVWAGFVSIINSLISLGAFGKHFPEVCPDGAGACGTNEDSFKYALIAEIPEIEFPFVLEKNVTQFWASERKPFSPDYLSVLDVIQFCYEHVALPIQGSYHSFFQHHHLDFDVDAGRIDFRNKVNRIFQRNRIAYELTHDGNIVRLTSEILSKELNPIYFKTPDATLNRMLEEARIKFLSPDKSVRRESLERLWDAWERVKTILSPDDKKKSVGILLDKCADEPKFRQLLEDEAKLLTTIGNTFHIRHSEVGQVEIKNSNQVDYLFYRLFSLILLSLKSVP